MEEEQQPRSRLVVADDSAIFRCALLALLEDLPAEIVGVAADGVEALELVRREQPDLLLLDLAMPRLDGLSVLERLRREDLPTRVVVVTGFLPRDVAEQALAAGALACLNKATKSVELLRQIGRFL